MTPELREVFRTLNVAEADFLVSRLRGAGFEPTLQNEQSALLMLGAAGGGIRIMVPASQFEEASRLVAEPGAEQR